jgi:hypothetical protein
VKFVRSLHDHCIGLLVWDMFHTHNISETESVSIIMKFTAAIDRTEVGP